MTVPWTPYSYRTDPAVPKFDDGQPLLVFDGLCVLCSTGVQWMLARDPDGTSRFAVIQSPIARALYRHYGLDADRFDTFMVLSGGIAHVKWQGVLAAARSLPIPWRWLGMAGRMVPSALGDPCYDLVQRNRIRWFGGRTTCFAPMSRLKPRFLDA
jgi:predicted DCC family thiol-disulfide oxidoreductase YuxK